MFGCKLPPDPRPNPETHSPSLAFEADGFAWTVTYVEALGRVDVWRAETIRGPWVHRGHGTLRAGSVHSASALPDWVHEKARRLAAA